MKARRWYVYERYLTTASTAGQVEITEVNAHRAEVVAEIVRAIRRIAAEETITRHTIGMVADFIEHEFGDK